MSKVTVVGATGNVGMFAAHAISEIPYVNEILLHGREGREDLLEGIAHDLMDSFAACGNYTKIGWTTDVEDIRGSSIVVFTAGVARTPGQNRLDLALKNARIVSELSAEIGMIAPDTKIFMVTNPVDVMTSVALKYSGLAPAAGVRTRNPPGFDETEIPHSRLLQSASERGPHADYRGTRRQHGPVVVGDDNRRHPDQQSSCILPPSGE